jgi:hypothetical protein
LTLPQAARLFDLEMPRCARVLDTLVTNGALWTDGHEFFGRNAMRNSAAYTLDRARRDDPDRR